MTERAAHSFVLLAHRRSTRGPYQAHLGTALLRTTTYTNGQRERETDRHRDGSVLSKCHLAELNLKKNVSPDLSDLGTTRGEQDEHEARFFGAGKSRSDATRAVDRETDCSRYKTGTGAGLLPCCSFTFFSCLR
jgi:hypothetical protein